MTAALERGRRERRCLRCEADNARDDLLCQDCSFATLSTLAPFEMVAVGGMLIAIVRDKKLLAMASVDEVESRGERGQGRTGLVVSITDWAAVQGIRALPAPTHSP